MLSTLKLALDYQELDYRQASILQGVMFENIDSAYAERMHQQNLHPYSQYIIEENGRPVWVINTLTDEAKEKIIDPLCRETFSSFKMRQRGDKEIQIIGKSLVSIERRNLLDEFYGDRPIRNIRLLFCTPTAFRRDGRYVILPELRMLYQSLMARYSASSTQVDMVDEDTLNEMASDSYILGYRLSSKSFPIEHTRIPGFTGSITIGFSGKSTVSHYIRLLLRFGEFSGVGVKTGMGMGAIKIIKETDTNERR